MEKASASYNVVFERDEDGYIVASVPELPGCHTQAADMEDAVRRVQEAISLYLEVEQDVPLPREFLGVQRVSI